MQKVGNLCRAVILLTKQRKPVSAHYQDVDLFVLTGLINDEMQSVYCR